jgi:hypothetical protein
LVYRKIKVSVISIIISLLVLPFILGLELSPRDMEQDGILYLIKEYRNSILLYGFYALPFMVCLGVPVTLLAERSIKKVKKFKVILNFLIHIIPAILFGFFLFYKLPLLLMGIPVIVAAIFFAVDEILQKERNIGIKAFFALVPMIITGIVLAPSILEKAETKRVMHEMDMNGPPQPVINVNGMTADIERPNACWDSDGSTGCPINKNPYILPIDPVGIDEFKVSGGIKVKIKMNNTDQDFTLQAYYIHQNETKEIKGKDIV